MKKTEEERRIPIRDCRKTTLIMIILFLLFFILLVCCSVFVGIIIWHKEFILKFIKDFINGQIK